MLDFTLTHDVDDLRRHADYLTPSTLTLTVGGTSETVSRADVVEHIAAVQAVVDAADHWDASWWQVRQSTRSRRSGEGYSA